MDDKEKKDLFSSVKISEAYKMFAGPQTDTISFRCTPELKKFISDMAENDKLNIKYYLINLVMDDYNIKYKKEVDRLKEELLKKTEQ